MSASDLAGSMIFVFERSFAVGFCPSIQMYSAVIFAKDVNLRSVMKHDSRTATIDESPIPPPAAARLLGRHPRRRRPLQIFAHPADDDHILAEGFGPVHGGIGAAQQVALLLLQRGVGLGSREVLG